MINGPRRSALLRRAGWGASLVLFVLWGVWLAAFATHLAVDHYLGDLGCEDPAGSSNYGHASWQWWYPGTRCAFEAAETTLGPVQPHVDQPTWLSGAAAVSLALWPTLCAGATVAFVRRSRRSNADVDGRRRAESGAVRAGAHDPA